MQYNVFTNAIQTYYTTYMSKKTKTFRLSERAVEILESQDNQSQFIEDLITGEQQAPDTEIIKRLKAMEERLLDTIGSLLGDLSTPLLKAPAEIKTEDLKSHTEDLKMRVSPTANNRDKNTIRTEIDKLEEERRKELEYVQDPETSAEVHKGYQERIDIMWREFHEQNR